MGHALRKAWLLLPATMLLVLLQLHISIVRNALAFVGGRTDVPLILVAADGCGTLVTGPAALRSEAAVAPRAACPGAARILTTMPRGRPITVFVNAIPVETRTANGPTATFDILLRGGPNRIAVHNGNTILAYPFASAGMPAELSAEHTLLRYRTSLGLVPDQPPANLLTLMAKPDASPAPRPLGLLPGGKTGLKILQGLPETMLRAGPSDAPESYSGPDGFAYLDGGDAQPSGKAPPVTRQLTVIRQPSGLVSVTLEGCLPPDNPVLGWARTGAIEAPEFIARMTGVQVGAWKRLDDPAWRDRHPVTFGTSGSLDCAHFQAAYAVSGGNIFSIGVTRFPVLPGDRMSISGFSGRLRVIGRPADAAADGESVWHSPADPAAVPSVSVSSDWLGDTDAPAAGPAAAPEAAGLFQAWRAVPDALPSLAISVLFGLAAALPTGLVCLALTRHLPASHDRGRILRARAGVLALLAFMLALACQPMLLAAERAVIDALDLNYLVRDTATQISFGTELYAPIALIVLIMLVPVLRAYQADGATPRHRLGMSAAAIISLALLAAATLVAYAERWTAALDGLPASDVAALPYLGGIVSLSPFPAPATALASLVLLWLGLAIGLMWVPIYWLFRGLLARGPLVGAAAASSVLVVLIPLITPAADCLRLLLTLRLGLYQEHYRETLFSAALAYLGPLTVISLIVMLLLRGFREITASMLPPATADRFRRLTPRRYVLLAAVIIVAPSARALALDPELAGLEVFDAMTLFQGYGTVLALLGLLAALMIETAALASEPAEARFHLADNTLLLLTAAFAGYMTLWLHEPLAVLALVGVGWLTFRHGLLSASGSALSTPPPGIAQLILAYRATDELAGARRKALEARFAKGKLSLEALEQQRQSLTAMTTAASTNLGLTLEEAKRRLFGTGPGSSPLDNAKRGAAAGFAVACLLQLALPLDLNLRVTGQAETWLSAIRAIVVDPSYRLIASRQGFQGVLPVLSELINALAIWVIAGFIFGYSFHRIRGGDGFTKALAFCGAIGLAFLLAQDLGASTGHASGAVFARLLPLFAFLLLLGSLVFDGATIRNQGLPLAKLPDVYGLRTSVGYASFAGLIAGLQPALEAFDWLTGK